MQGLTEHLAKGHPMPLVQYLLGATFHMLHEPSISYCLTTMLANLEALSGFFKRCYIYIPLRQLISEILSMMNLLLTIFLREMKLFSNHVPP
jgi:hypothetical protein